MTIVAASDAPGLASRLQTGDAAFDADIFVSAAEHSAYGLFDAETRQEVRRLVARGVVFTGAALRRQPPVMHEASLRADMQLLGERLTKTEAAAMAAMQDIALTDPLEPVRRRYRELVGTRVFRVDLSHLKSARLLAELETLDQLEPLRDIALNTTVAISVRIAATQRLMERFPPHRWRDVVATLDPLLPARGPREALLTTFVAAVEREPEPDCATIEALTDFAIESEAFDLPGEWAATLIRLGERASVADPTDAERLTSVLEDLALHDDVSVARSAFELLYRIAPDVFSNGDWVHYYDELERSLSRLPLLVPGTTFGPAFVAGLDGELSRRIFAGNEASRHEAIRLLAEYGRPAHLPLLVPLSRGLFAPRRQKALAKDAIARIHARYPNVDGGLSIASEGATLALVSPDQDEVM